MSAEINAVAFAGWDVSVSSAAHAGWLAIEEEAPVIVAPPKDGVSGWDDEWSRRREEEDMAIAMVIAFHESRRG